MKNQKHTTQSQAENNSLQIFEHDTFGKVRTITIDGEPWFVGKDVTAILGYNNGSRDLNRHVDPEDRQNYRNGTSEINNRGVTIINESGLYSLILSSKLPQARAFRRWITADVIPSIRRHGAYITEDTLAKMAASPEFTDALIEALVDETAKNMVLESTVEVLKDENAVLHDKNATLQTKNHALHDKNTTLTRHNHSLAGKVGALEDEVDELTPNAHYCERVLLSGDAIQTSIIAKEYGLTAVMFNRLLHDLGIQYKMGNVGTWLLYQQYADMGYTKTKTFYTPSGECVCHTYWTQLGRRFLYDTLAELGIYPVNERPPAFEF